MQGGDHWRQLKPIDHALVQMRQHVASILGFAALCRVFFFLLSAFRT